MSAPGTGPPKEVEGRTPHHRVQPSTIQLTSDAKADDTQQCRRYDGLAANQRRRGAAVRTEGGDPEYPGTSYHRPTTGFRATGYREGYIAALGWVLREHAANIDELLRAKLAAVINRAEAS